jgi:hypothetical protein
METTTVIGSGITITTIIMTMMTTTDRTLSITALMCAVEPAAQAAFTRARILCAGHPKLPALLLDQVRSTS